jgi:hypothetical protein
MGCKTRERDAKPGKGMQNRGKGCKTGERDAKPGKGMQNRGKGCKTRERDATNIPYSQAYNAPTRITLY